MACRLPGNIKSPEDYWHVLSEGKDVVTEVSSDRWGTDFYSHPDKNEPGKSYTFAAGVLDNIDLFDPAFFGISPREADQMDPQQRLLLELAWETLENAGVPAERIKGSECAVYVGIASNDYAHRRTDDLASLDAYTMTGNTASVASNRISYTFDLRGPSVSVDTACSSSLVAIHEACKSLWLDEAPVALCGGINMLVHPFPFVGFSKASMLSPTGRCRAFDASGDGYVRSEGAGMLLLKPLAQAEADGDRIHAVIVNSGVNCDGNTSGITVPGMETQSALLERVYRGTGVTADDLSYVEAHGTGTPVGDPLEATALGNALGKLRDTEKPLLIGSAKTNLGHLETASGMAGFLKATLSLKNKTIPSSLHFKAPNPNIDLQRLNLKVVTENTPLNQQIKPHYIGINSFGFGGANAHILLEEYKTPTSASQTAEAPEISASLILSSRTPEALKALAARYANQLQAIGSSRFYDIAYSARFKRSKFSNALALSGLAGEAAIDSLRNFADSGRSEHITTGEHLNNAKLAFVFTGNGCQWQGMGQSLYQDNAIFKNAFNSVDQILNSIAPDYSLTEALMQDEENSSLERTEVAQPLLFAIQVAIASVLETYGIEPEAVLGHSVGEVAAAWASGALSLEQATHVIYFRSQAQALTAGQGRMAAIGVSRELLTELLTQIDGVDSIEVAGENSPNALTIAGDLDDIERLGALLSSQGKFYRLLDLNYAFHSRKMNPIEDSVKTNLKSLTPLKESSSFISTVTGAPLSGTELGAEYWWKNIRHPVLFGKAIEHLIDDGYNVFVEIGPHPILRSYINESLKNKGTHGQALETLKRKQDSQKRLHTNALRIILSGCKIDEHKLFPVEGKHVELPSYPWQKERYWYPLTVEGYDLVNRRREHPLLGYRLKDSDITWENNLDTTELPYLADHVVDDAIIFPAAAYIEMALAASKLWMPEDSYQLEMVEIPAPIVFEPGQSKKVRFALDPKDGSFKISSRDRLSDDEWTQNAMGRLLGKSYKQQQDSIPEALATDFVNIVGAEEHYNLATTVGLSYGPAFQAVSDVKANTNQAIANLVLPSNLQAGIDAYLLHPSLLDSGFQVLVDICKQAIDQGERKALIPIQIGRLHLFGSSANHATKIQVDVIRQSQRSVIANFYLTDDNGLVLAELQNCRFRQLQFKKAMIEEITQYNYVAELQSQKKYWPATPDTSGFIGHVKKELVKNSDALKRPSHFREFSLLLDMMCVRYAFDAIQQLNLENSFTLDDLRRQLPEAQHPLLTKLTSMLENNDLLAVSDGLATLQDPSDFPEAISIWEHIVQQSPEYLPEVLLLSQCGEALPKVLSGELDSDKLLRADKSSLFEQMLEVGPNYRSFNQALSKAVLTSVANWPSTQRCRILLIASYPAQISYALLDELDNGQTDLVIASDNAANLSSIERTLDDRDWASAAVIDLNQLDSSTFTAPFDFICIAHLLHESDNLPETLSSLKSLMNEKAQLIILERSPDHVSDIMFGSQPDWWHENQPRLMEPSNWLTLLSSAGLDNTTSLNEPDALDFEGVFLLSATNPDTQTLITQQAVEQETWLVITGQQQEGFTQHLLQAITAESIHCTIACEGDSYREVSNDNYVFNTSSSDDLNRLLALQPFDRVLFLSGYGTEIDLLDPVCALQGLLLALESVPHPPQLSLLTKGGSVFSNTLNGVSFNPLAAPVWGLGRVVMNEYPDLHCRLIDIQCKQLSFGLMQSIINEITENTEETEVVITTEARYVLRMKRHIARQGTEPLIAPAAALDFKTPGSFKNLYWKALPEVSLQPDEIEIKPIAAGLNFRDVMYAMGLLSDEAVENGFAGATLGMEVAGTVVRTGSNVQEFNIGDEVLGFAPACFSSRVVTTTTATAHKPSAWSFEEAATIPTAFFTVYYAFSHLAQLQPGEKVLIHGASGGVGLAAIQLARHMGAVVFAAAGTSEKRAMVKHAGADYVMDSRSLAFAEEILRLTEGKGVDVILNSVYGEAVNRNLAILKPFGRLLELGKRDFYENSRIGLRPFRNNITYFGIDADQLLTERAELARRLFKELMELFHDGALHPLPYRVFDSSRIQDSFRYMQQSRQIGKVIINLSNPQATEQNFNSTKSALHLDPKANYLITGGLSGFGLRTAKWLAEKGALHLTLLGRKGVVTLEAKEAVSELQSSGITVYVPPCDVSDLKQLTKVMNELETTAPALRGIIHAATLFDDSLLRNLSRERLDKVLKPKALGAWNLHQLTQASSLEFFVLYSSATTLFGNPGQGNYVAANYMLESLVSHRRSLGLAASYAAWGAISDAGFLARNKDTQESLLSRLGGAALSADQAMKELEQLIISGDQGAAMINFDWKTINRAMPSAKSPKFTQQNNWLLLHGGSSGENEDFFTRIADLDDLEVIALIEELLTLEISNILRLPVEKIDTTCSIYDLGMDSLMGMELLMAIEEKFNAKIPLMSLTEGGSISKISEKIHAKLGGRDHDNDEVLEGLASKHGAELSEDAINEINHTTDD